MNRLHRRRLAAFGFSAFALIALSACTNTTPTTPTTNTVQVTLSNVQKQAAAVYAALAGFVAGAEAVTSTKISAAIKIAYSELGAAVSSLSGISPTSSPIQDIEAVISLVSQVIGLLPAGTIPAATMAVITISLTLLNALVAGIGSIVFTLPPSPASAPLIGTSTVRVIAAPIPIPLS